MTEPTGRRAVSKMNTRNALQEAADRLFAERGYQATTVRDIADAAGVTERTFFRYFPGKEALIMDDALGWLPVLQDLVRARPAGEDVVTALRHAVLDLGAVLAADTRPSPLWLFSEGPPGPRIGQPMRGVVARVESSLAEVIRERLELSEAAFAIETSYLADVLARSTFAILRSALIRESQLRRDGRSRPSATTLINQAFSTMRLPAPPPATSARKSHN